MSASWVEGFFDQDYLDVWQAFVPPERTEREADGLWDLLELAPGRRVLDAPCGWGRLALALAQRGAVVLGVDQSRPLLDAAERARGDVPAERLRYVQADLRTPLGETGFDVALNVFSSLGYGTETDDVAILKTLAAAVRPGGLVFVETIHRDLAAARVRTGASSGLRGPDGTLVVEMPRFEPVTGRVETTFHFWGPRGHGQKSASLRIYSATELVRLVEEAGLRFRSAHRACTKEPFVGEDRLGLVAVRP